MFALSWNAWSWQGPEIVDVARLGRMQTVEGHMCAYGLQVVNTDGVCQVGEVADGLDVEQLVPRGCSCKSLLQLEVATREPSRTLKRRAGKTPPREGAQ